MLENNRDKNLLSQCIPIRNEDAWEQFVRTYSRLIWSAIYRTFKASSFTCSPEDAEDIYRSLFVSLLEDDFLKLRQYQAGHTCSLATWLTVVTVRKTIDHMRRQRTRSHAMVFPDNWLMAETIADVDQNRGQFLMHARESGSHARSICSLINGDCHLRSALLMKGSPPGDARDMGTTLP